MRRRGEPIERLLGEYMERRISRRDFFKRAGALGLSMSAAGTLLAACGGKGASGSSVEAETGTAVRGGILREGYDRDVSRQDPVNQAWWDASGYPVQHETVLCRDPDNNFVPMLAEKWETSPDGLTWTLTIRDGLTFHSGAPCDAAAVAACFDEFRDPEKGINAGFWAPVKNVEASGNVVTVTMSHPYPGTATPFIQNQGPAHLDGITWIVLTEPATRAQELEQGNLDALHGPASQDVDRLKGNGDLAVIEFPEMSLYQLGLNFKETDLGFDNVEVRQGISHAIDRQAIVDTVFFGLGSPTYTIVNEAWPYYDSGVEQFNQFDPDKAKQLLGGRSISFECIIEADKTEQLVAQAVQQMLKDVGVDMKLTSYGSDYFEKLLGGPQAYMIKQLWSNLLDASLLFSDSRFFAPACCNASYTKIPELDAAFQKWQTAGSEDELRTAASEVQMVAAEQLPFVPIVTPSNVWVHHKRVHGWAPLSSTLYPYYNDVWLEA
jgi:peptide/nickel transport system substrate-binding protein